MRWFGACGRGMWGSWLGDGGNVSREAKRAVESERPFFFFFFPALLVSFL